MPTIERIVPRPSKQHQTVQETSWLRAFETAKLPTNRQWDDLLVVQRSSRSEEIAAICEAFRLSSDSFFWSRELITSIPPVGDLRAEGFLLRRADLPKDEIEEVRRRTKGYHGELRLIVTPREIEEVTKKRRFATYLRHPYDFFRVIHPETIRLAFIEGMWQSAFTMVPPPPVLIDAESRFPLDPRRNETPLGSRSFSITGKISPVSRFVSRGSPTGLESQIIALQRAKNDPEPMAKVAEVVQVET